jgi:hypothetical protein
MIADFRDNNLEFAQLPVQLKYIFLFARPPRPTVGQVSEKLNPGTALVLYHDSIDPGGLSIT